MHNSIGQLKAVSGKESGGNTNRMQEQFGCGYDGNGNPLSDGYRTFRYDAENQLTNVMVSNAWSSAFVYDGKMRRRIRREYTWATNSAWQLTAHSDDFGHPIRNCRTAIR